MGLDSPRRGAAGNIPGRAADSEPGPPGRRLGPPGGHQPPPAKGAAGAALALASAGGGRRRASMKAKRSAERSTRGTLTWAGPGRDRRGGHSDHLGPIGTRGGHSSGAEGSGVCVGGWGWGWGDVKARAWGSCAIPELGRGIANMRWADSTRKTSLVPPRHAGSPGPHPPAPRPSPRHRSATLLHNASPRSEQSKSSPGGGGGGRRARHLGGAGELVPPQQLPPQGGEGAPRHLDRAHRPALLFPVSDLNIANIHANAHAHAHARSHPHARAHTHNTHTCTRARKRTKI